MSEQNNVVNQSAIAKDVLFVKCYSLEKKSFYRKLYVYYIQTILLPLTVLYLFRSFSRNFENFEQSHRVLFFIILDWFYWFPFQFSIINFYLLLLSSTPWFSFISYFLQVYIYIFFNFIFRNFIYHITIYISKSFNIAHVHTYVV